MSNRDLARRQVRDDFRYKERRNLSRSAFEIGLFRRLDCIDPAQADADNDPNVFRFFGIEFESAIFHRHRRRRDAVLDEEIHFFDLFRLDEIFGSEIRHHTRNT